MPIKVPLPRVLAKSGWRVKVFDDEGPETPHVTIQYKTARIWRVSLRDRRFLVPGGRWSDIPRAIKTAIDSHWEALRIYWNRQNPHNPIESSDNE
jgi:hypothetical protein